MKKRISLYVRSVLTFLRIVITKIFNIKGFHSAFIQDFSITNIKINEENREDIHGQLQISFKRAEDLQEACEIIEKATDFTVV